jgi:hypothetical protein
MISSCVKNCRMHILGHTPRSLNNLLPNPLLLYGFYWADPPEACGLLTSATYDQKLWNHLVSYLGNTFLDVSNGVSEEAKRTKNALMTLKKEHLAQLTFRTDFDIFLVLWRRSRLKMTLTYQIIPLVIWTLKVNMAVGVVLIRLNDGRRRCRLTNSST